MAISSPFTCGHCFGCGNELGLISRLTSKPNRLVLVCQGCIRKKRGEESLTHKIDRHPAKAGYCRHDLIMKLQLQRMDKALD